MRKIENQLTPADEAGIESCMLELSQKAEVCLKVLQKTRF